LLVVAVPPFYGVVGKYLQIPVFLKVVLLDWQVLIKPKIASKWLSPVKIKLSVVR
jgi:hypothetical protein